MQNIQVIQENLELWQRAMELKDIEHKDKATMTAILAYRIFPHRDRLSQGKSLNEAGEDMQKHEEHHKYIFKRFAKYTQTELAEIMIKLLSEGEAHE